MEQAKGPLMLGSKEQNEKMGPVHHMSERVHFYSVFYDLKQVPEQRICSLDQ